jgi:hypothetical protein
VDPTNAHFNEDKSIKNNERIWMDVVDELKDKLQYLLRCNCLVKKGCTCFKHWTHSFYRMKEIPPIREENGEIYIDYAKRIERFAQFRFFKTMIVWFYNEYLWKRTHIQSEEEQNAIGMEYWKLSELKEVRDCCINVLGCTEEQWKTGEGIVVPKIESVIKNN